VFPGGVPIAPESAQRFGAAWGFPVPEALGLTAVEALAAAGRGELDAYYVIGGNFLETMPEPDRIADALRRIPLRIHSDIVLTHQMLVEPADVVFLLPAATRYEQRDGGTETTTERRVVFSPHIEGHQVGEARSEWELLLDLARAVKPAGYEQVHFESGAAIRADIAKAVPFYAGIENLAAQGDQFQWGGPHLCADRTFPTPDGRAQFQPVTPPDLDRPVDGETFVLATRRGKQVNSMIQNHRDPLTGAERDHVFISPGDARRLALQTGDPIRLRSRAGEFFGRAFVADVTPGTLQGHWPEMNVLIAAGRVEPSSGVPDYNAEVTVQRVTGNGKR
jgi:predicted molibdopterin-dependent oxidoreductase YjgC